jgi:hypothetical protein
VIAHRLNRTRTLSEYPCRWGWRSPTRQSIRPRASGCGVYFHSRELGLCCGRWLRLRSANDCFARSTTASLGQRLLRSANVDFAQPTGFSARPTDCFAQLGCGVYFCSRELGLCCGCWLRLRSANDDFAQPTTTSLSQRRLRSVGLRPGGLTRPT